MKNRREGKGGGLVKQSVLRLILSNFFYNYSLGFSFRVCGVSCNLPFDEMLGMLWWSFEKAESICRLRARKDKEPCLCDLMHLCCLLAVQESCVKVNVIGFVWMFGGMPFEVGLCLFPWEALAWLSWGVRKPIQCLWNQEEFSMLITLIDEIDFFLSTGYNFPSQLSFYVDFMVGYWLLALCSQL